MDTSGSVGNKEDDGLPRLTAAEDGELRQLTWFSKAGQLSEPSHGRLEDLKARDRRSGIRDPRPDPISRAGDEVGERLRLDQDGSNRCPNCGWTRGHYAQASLCSICGARLETVNVEGDGVRR
jgi:hypothetical protein